MIRVDLGRTLALAQKEAREYRRTPFIVGAMVVLPFFFLVEPMLTIFVVPASEPARVVDKTVGAIFLLMLVVPTVIPATVAAYSVVGERQQGTLEPLLITPVRREEILLGKALSAVVPSVAIAYLLFALVEICAALFAANPHVSAILTEGPHILAEAIFAPLLAMWSIWVGTAVSTRSSDVRVAQQLGTLASLPPLAVTALVSFQVLPPVLGVAIGFAAGLLALDIGMWWVVSSMFDREQLVTGSRPAASSAAAPGPGEVRRIRA